MTTKEHYQNGLDSNFSLCCIAWFFIRMQFVVRGWYKPSTRARPDGQYNHVVCPFCVVIHKLLKQEIFYSYCRDCDWLQYRKIKCNKCNKMPYNPLERRGFQIVPDEYGGRRLISTPPKRYHSN